MRKVLLCTAAGVLALALGCGKSSQSPTSPSSAATGAAGAAADGSTLKATAPTPVSPINGTQPDSLVLVATKSQAKYADAPLSYQFQIRSGSTVVFDSQVVPGLGNGPDQVQYTPSAALAADTTFTWRARAAYQGAVGPWSSDATFKAPAGGYIRGSELFDPLTSGRTVGQLNGGATLTPDGVYLPEHESHVTYALPQTLTAGEFSMMITGINPSQMRGAKSKAFSMEEGFGDITTNDYRVTVDLRGRAYPTPGQVRFRFITGDAGNRVFDAGPVNPGWDPAKWYFWRLSWNTGQAVLEVRENDENGPTKLRMSTGTGSHDYRPTPHVLYLGQPIGRGGDDDATVTGITIKNVWASANPRPAFPK
jgi:hypothetical protein